MRSRLGWRYHLCATQRTLHLCRSGHGCLHAYDKSLASESAFDAIFDLETLEEALHRSVPEIHHSDQGVQYLSNAYISTLKRHDIEISVARRGCPWENGYAERLIRTLKEEEVHLNAYEDIHEARSRIGHFITQVYNQKRPHSALGYLTPMEFQQKNLS